MRKMRTSLYLCVSLCSLIILLNGCRNTAQSVKPEIPVEPKYTHCDYDVVRQSFVQGDYARLLLDSDVISNSDIGQENNARALYYLAVAHMMQGDYNASRKILSTLKKSKETIPPDILEQVDLAIAKISYQEGNFANAVREFEDFIKEYSTSDYLASTHYLLGQALQKKGDFEKAKKVFDAIPAQFPLSFESKLVSAADTVLSDFFRLQVDSFFERENAARRLEELKQKGFNDVVILKTEKEGTFIYRVQVGSFKDRKEAVAFKDELKKAGFDSFIYP